jgi:hypothetical protein
MPSGEAVSCCPIRSETGIVLAKMKNIVIDNKHTTRLTEAEVIRLSIVQE